MRSLLLSLFLAVPLFSGCATVTPLEEAETIEQKVYAAYGTFVIFEEQAAKIVQSPEVPDNIKAALSQADAKAKPAVDAMLDGVMQVIEVKAALAAGETTEAKLEVVNANLLTWYTKAFPLI